MFLPCAKYHKEMNFEMRENHVCDRVRDLFISFKDDCQFMSPSVYLTDGRISVYTIGKTRVHSVVLYDWNINKFYFKVKFFPENILRLFRNSRNVGWQWLIFLITLYRVLQVTTHYPLAFCILLYVLYDTISNTDLNFQLNLFSVYELYMWYVNYFLRRLSLFFCFYINWHLSFGFINFSFYAYAAHLCELCIKLINSSFLEF